MNLQRTISYISFIEGDKLCNKLKDVVIVFKANNITYHSDKASDSNAPKKLSIFQCF